MKIAFFGVPEAGIVCLNALMQHKKNIIAVIPPIPSHPVYSMMVGLAEQYSIPVLGFNSSPKEENFINAFRDLKADVAVVCSFDHLLPAELIEIPPLGFINCHPSLLPEYRGGNPFFHVIANGEKKTGVTIHYMDPSFDTGDIISQWEGDVAPDETLGTLFNRSNLQTTHMLIDVINRLEKGEKITGTPQIKEGNYKRASIILPEKGHTIIDWSKDAAYTERFTRALNPFFGAITYFRGCMLKIWSGVCMENQMVNQQPGTIINVTPDNIAIATGKGLFFPTCFQVGNFVISDIKDFINRTNPQVGESFTDKA
ncbi:MAG: Methionyl-tRNA formyltransferase [uncultured bacterium]|nr:MAG: Methionyl-tRNA formyltransferase [uncultured bacterium]HBH18623.1 hypothetical protein [Cyanobacteria bacterium UBA9579]